MRFDRLLPAIAVLGVFVTVTVAAAKAQYDHSTPGPGEVVSRQPARIDIYTRRPTSPVPGNTQVIVIDRDQRHVDSGDVVVDPTDHDHFSVGLQPGLPPGRYVVTFKTLGETDLDLDGGEFAFYLGVQPDAAARAADRSLALTIDDGDLTITGYRRGIIEGGLTAIIAVPVALHYIQKRRRKAGDAATPEEPR
ncbi:MAG TPA: copper resistance protein CopC [Dehalococcoidia bacterium]